MARPRVAFLLPLLLVAAVCPRGGDDETVSPQAAPTSEDLEWAMKEHFDEVAAIRDAIIVGELDTVTEHAQTLAHDVDPERYPLAWRPHVVDLLAAAQALERPSTVQTASASAAKLAATCGQCHAAQKARPEFGDAMEPSDEDTIAARMERHRWAVERMWEGIVGPSDESWGLGAAAFSGPPGCGDAFADDPEGEKRRELCDNVDRLGRQAARATDHEARVRHYGDFLATCAGCHAGEPDA